MRNFITPNLLKLVKLKDSIQSKIALDHYHIKLEMIFLNKENIHPHNLEDKEQGHLEKH